MNSAHIVLLLAAVVLVSLQAECQTQQQQQGSEQPKPQQQQQQQPQLSQQQQFDPKVSNQTEANNKKPNEQQDKKSFLPFVDVNKVNNATKVDVHVPIVFDMTNENDPTKSKLDLSVLQGLVTVTKDKTRDDSGRLNGPLKVTVFGIPIYAGKGESSRVLAEPNVGTRAQQLAGRVQENVQVGSERLFSTLSRILSRLSTMAKDKADQATGTVDVRPPQQVAALTA